MKVLVIEDQHRIARYVKKGLEQKSMVVDVARDGVAGYDLASEGTYDVIILDIMLPKRDGIEVLKMLRDEGNHTPVLLLTAKDQMADKVRGFEAGADDYLSKPFAFVELLSRVKALAKRSKTITTTTLQAGDLILDVHTYEVRRGNTSIQLSRMEFVLLEFLLRNKGRVFTPSDLTEYVWSYESDVTPNAAQVYIGYLRKKIDKAFPRRQALIHTVRGFGYKVDAKN